MSIDSRMAAPVSDRRIRLPIPAFSQGNPTLLFQKKKARSSSNWLADLLRYSDLGIYYAMESDLIDFDRHVSLSDSAKPLEQQQEKLRKRIMRREYSELL
jgi:hypothetical protein